MSTDFLTSCLVPSTPQTSAMTMSRQDFQKAQTRQAALNARPLPIGKVASRPAAVPRGAGIIGSAPHMHPEELAPFSWGL